MIDTDALAFYDALPPDEQVALDLALAEQPALAEAFARWQSLRAEVRASLAQAMPDRTLLVLHALSDRDLLSDDETARLDAARPELDAALAQHPGLAAAAARVQSDRDAFEAAWEEAAAPVAPPRARAEQPRAGRPRAERPRAERTRPEPAASRRAARRARPTRWAWRVAALTAVVAFAGVLTMLWNRDAGWETVVADGARTVAFADGSTADLADGARLAVPGGGLDDARQARLLAGRALFRIERNPADPFEVTTPNAEVAVLGTTFSVQASDVETEVVLVSGVVTLAPRATPGAAVTLAPGQRSTVLALDAPSPPEPADLGALDWSGTVFARDLTLGELAERLSRQSGTPVVVAPSLAGLKVADEEYGADGLRDALDKLAMTFGARLQMEGSGFRLAP